ncbi:MAG: SemiSWEET transporter [archaeon]
MNYTIIGLLAGTCTSIAFLPQVVRTWKLKETRDLSLAMFLVLGTGVVLWTIYGILTKDLPIILANVVTLTFVLLMIGFKLKYK